MSIEVERIEILISSLISKIIGEFCLEISFYHFLILTQKFPIKDKKWEKWWPEVKNWDPPLNKMTHLYKKFWFMFACRIGHFSLWTNPNSNPAQ